MNVTIQRMVVNGMIIFFLSILLLVAGTWWRLNTQFAVGEGALRRGDYAGAVAGYESALHMYLPLSPLIGKAAERLWQIGEANERVGDIDRALCAYRALRSSFYADHWLVTPGKPWLEKCDTKIAALVPLQHER